ncbi:cobyric acid synthase [Jongsikchunia kroppenstedtii]|uniref:cobyric acid synthase n=1 Tax=Jongsikchunia kroppenstedtii TaxID=1121721 RepID=UPI0003A9406A|nr:cobyric acid synthase [Jongsikchunia kroppenstedtii]
MTGGALLVAGTSSDAGKSLVVAALCRSLRRRGLSVAPFKAQNMSNNSVVTADGGEIGRAQAMQAAAAGVEPSVRFNPVLLKPGSDRRSQVVVRGKAIGSVGATDYHQRRAELADVVNAELAALRNDFEVVLCEGAGSPAEINLRRSDITNMGLARAADMPVIVVGDIDRGGVLAHLLGTVAALEPDDQRLIAGFLINKFRGDPGLLQPGLDDLERRTGRPTYGVLPFDERLWLDAEDSLGVKIGATVGIPHAGRGSQRLRVGAIRLPRVSNTTDVEALAAEPGVDVTWVDDPGSIAAADLVVLPGTKATVDDLGWLRQRGLADALVERAGRGGPILAICGGYQMLARSIVDPVESGVGVVAGLGLLDLEVEFDADKILINRSGIALGEKVSGYEIHHGRVVGSGDQGLLVADDGTSEGSVRGSIIGTHWHGLFVADEFRKAFLRTVADRAGRDFVVDEAASFARLQEDRFDAAADLVDEYVDVDALIGIAQGRPLQRPVLRVSMES